VSNSHANTLTEPYAGGQQSPRSTELPRLMAMSPTPRKTSGERGTRAVSVLSTRFQFPISRRTIIPICPMKDVTHATLDFSISLLTNSVPELVIRYAVTGWSREVTISLEGCLGSRLGEVGLSYGFHSQYTHNGDHVSLQVFPSFITPHSSQSRGVTGDTTAWKIYPSVSGRRVGTRRYVFISCSELWNQNTTE
jgi:hypothetical protein